MSQKLAHRADKRLTSSRGMCRWIIEGPYDVVAALKPTSKGVELLGMYYRIIHMGRCVSVEVASGSETAGVGILTDEPAPRTVAEFTTKYGTIDDPRRQVFERALNRVNRNLELMVAETIAYAATQKLLAALTNTGKPPKHGKRVPVRANQ